MVNRCRVRTCCRCHGRAGDVNAAAFEPFKTQDGALSVDACLGLSRTVHVYARGVDESFAQFRVRPPPNANSPAAEVGDIFTGRLFGDLRTGGFAAFTSDAATFLPASSLFGPASLAVAEAHQNPRHVGDVPAPDATAEAVVRSGVFDKVMTQYVVSPKQITRTRSSANRPAAIDSIRIDTVRRVRLQDLGDNGFRLVIAGDQVTFHIPQSAYAEDFPRILGQRLREHRRQDVVEDNRTRIHLGLVGHGRKAQGRPNDAD